MDSGKTLQSARLTHMGRFQVHIRRLPWVHWIHVHAHAFDPGLNEAGDGSRSCWRCCLSVSLTYKLNNKSRPKPCPGALSCEYSTPHLFLSPVTTTRGKGANVAGILALNTFTNSFNLHSRKYSFYFIEKWSSEGWVSAAHCGSVFPTRAHECLCHTLTTCTGLTAAWPVTNKDGEEQLGDSQHPPANSQPFHARSLEGWQWNSLLSIPLPWNLISP